MIVRSQCQDFIARLQEPRRTIQVVAGPRQVGKTTMVKQALQQLSIPSRFFNADGVDEDSKEWISACWEEVRSQKAFNHSDEMIVAFDEIHKINNWSEQVKREWDADTFHDVNIKVVLLGSSRLLLKKGLTESLAGRFEMIPMGHWSYAEMHEAFGLDINQYIYFGGYPGSAPYVSNESRWRKYMREAIIAPAIEKDVLLTTFIYKPALMHQLFRLGCAYSGELLSYNKMLGMLQDSGNATTLVNYLEVLGESKLLIGLPKYVIDASRKYRTIPKLQVYNNGLLTALSDGLSYEKVRTDPKLWGRWVESAVGCYLLDKVDELDGALYYWRENNEEVDFIVRRGEKLLAIEVKSDNTGLGTFLQHYHPQHSLVVGGNAMPLEDLFQGDIETLL